MSNEEITVTEYTVRYITTTWNTKAGKRVETLHTETFWGLTRAQDLIRGIKANHSATLVSFTKQDRMVEL